MILDRLDLHNFSVYRGRQSFNLTPLPNRPVTLIGGLNGTGKTSLLDALQLVLFGRFAHCSNRGGLAYDEFLRRSVHRSCNSAEGGALELAFRHTSNGVEHSYLLHRSWNLAGENIRERLEVVRDGLFDRALTESWEEVVDSFFPLRIANFFLFDGEEIEAFADFENCSDVLATAIRSLLGIDLVDQLLTDLVVLERRKQLSGKKTDDQVAVASLTDEIRQSEARREELVFARGHARNEVDRRERAFRELDSQYREQGGGIYERRHELEARKEALLSRLRRVEEALREAAADVIPLLLVEPLLAAIDDQDKREEIAAKNETLVEVLVKRDEQLLQAAVTLGVKKGVASRISEFLMNDRNARLSTLRVDRVLDLNNETRQNLRSLLADGLQRAAAWTKNLLGEFEELQNRIADTDRALATVPELDAIAALVEKRQRALEAVEEARVRYKTLEEELQKVVRQCEHQKNVLGSLLEKQVNQDFLREDATRVIFHSSRVRKTLKRFNKELLRRHVKNISRLILDSFQHLLRKEKLISDLKINPETFMLELTGPDGRQLSSARLSAGERQLLAVSILWGLARASGRALPAVIDTPLGRLDAYHRNQLVERYFPYASHQVVLLSTDEEIDEEYYVKIRPWVGAVYTLKFDNEIDGTTVEPGYFW